MFYPSVSAQEINFITYLQRPKKQDKWLSPDLKPVTAAVQASTADSHRALCCQICHVCIKQCNRAVRRRNYLLTCAPPLLKFVARLRFWSSSVSTFRAFQKLWWGAEDLPAVTWYMMDSTETFCSTSLIITQTFIAQCHCTVRAYIEGIHQNFGPWGSANLFEGVVDP